MKKLITLFVISFAFINNADAQCVLNLGGSGCGTNYIDNVTILSTALNNNSACNSNTLNGTYTSFAPGANTTATLTAGSSYVIGVRTTASNIESLWIDYNQSGTFDPSEHTQITLSSVANQYSSISFAVPVTALGGTCAMRVRSRTTGGTNGPTNACTNFLSGDCEDYVLTIIAAPGCTGTPNAGIANSTSTLVCSGNTVNVSLSGQTIAAGLTYQWQSSPNGLTWTSIPNATITSVSQTITATIYYQCVVSCGTNTAASTPVQVTLFSGAVAGAISGPTLVAFNSINSYTVSPAAGNLQWYQGPSATGPWTIIAGATASVSSITANPSGIRYYRVIATLAGCSSATTAASFSVTVTSAAGDDVCTALVIVLGPSTTKYKFSGFGVQPGEVAPPGGGCTSNSRWCNSTLQNSRWFSFVAPASGYVSVQTPDMDSQLAIWKATTCSGLLSAATATLIAANDDDAAYVAHGGIQYSSYTRGACLTPGSTYFVQVDTYSIATVADSTRLIILDMGAPMNASFTGLAAAYCLGAPSTTLIPATTGGIFTRNTSTVAITSFTPNTAGTFTVTYAAYGCVTSSVTVVASCTGIGEEVAADYDVNIYPNPNKGVINVVVSDFSSENIIEIYDAIGKLVISKTLTANQTTINTSELNVGIYTYRIGNSSGVINRGKFIKE